MARRIESGVGFADAIWSEPRIPVTVIPFVMAGEKSGSLPEAFRVVAELFEERAQDRTRILSAILPQFAAIIVIMAVLTVIPALIMPMISLISSLANW